MKFYIDSLWLSPYTYSVLSALREKKIPFELEEVRFESNRSVSGPFKDRTFTDLIPAIEEDGFLLSESLAILEYLEDRYPEPALFPRDPVAKARCRQLEAAADEVLFPHVLELVRLAGDRLGDARLGMAEQVGPP